jgi:nitrate reductase (NAD(P)H)
LKRQKQKEEKEKEEKEKKEQEEKQEQEHKWKAGDLHRRRHNDAYASSGGQEDSKTADQDNDKQDGKDDKKDSQDDSQKPEQADSDEQKDSKPKSEYEKLREKYSIQEIALLRSLQEEKKIVQSIKQSDGKMKSPWAHLKPSDVIDDSDRASPDNWIPRNQNMIRLTGKHPLNCEYPLSDLYETGLITPNRLHYVRNHGPVPHLLWETHELDIENGKCKFSMDDLVNKFDSVNIAVALACDGNRRKELNMVKRSKGFNWGAGAISNAFWKGAMLSDVLKAAGVDYPTNGAGTRRWVNFAGSDEPSEGTYETCIPYEYAMDPVNDVLLAYEMNDVKLPRYVGGRQVKWLSKIWISEKENDSHYHIWDNRVLVR